jgi:pimeloyl-ACP methyl ester carboxylesterase
MTEFLNIDGGQIAYEVTGDGPLVVLSPGIGDRRQAYRFLVPKLAQAGYRVASADLRGHGESSMGWASVTGKDAITRTDVANDLLALVRRLGGPAVIVGHSISGGAATIAAATDRSWSAASWRSTRSPAPKDSTLAGCSGSGATGGA